MVQTGDPTNTGKGGESIWGGKFQDEIKDDLKHKTRGVLSMANSGPNSNGSQWFLTYAPQPSLDLKYTVFGKVIDGWDTLDEHQRSHHPCQPYGRLTDFLCILVLKTPKGKFFTC